MSPAMLLRSGTAARLLALTGALCLLLSWGACGARAASEAANNALFGKPKTQKARSTPQPQFPIPASARPQGTSTGTTKTSTAVTRTQRVPPGITTPHIATNGPQSNTTGAATTPTGAGSTGTSTTSTVPVTPTTPASATPGLATPTTSTAPSGAKGLAPEGATPTRQAVGHGRDSISAVAIVAAALAALLIVICLLWGTARWYAYEPHWTVSMRHSLAEAGLRMSATWDELADWARLGR